MLWFTFMGFQLRMKREVPSTWNSPRRYGFNLYLARLANHGLAGEESMTDMTPNGLIESAKQAVGDWANIR